MLQELQSKSPKDRRIQRNNLQQYFMQFFLKAIFPVDTGHKLNVHKTSRRRPGRLLNVLCTFNLRPVCTGFEEVSI